ncbi:MAG: hypothetical protein HN580_07800 [Deltaproteobacteria bacterium]|nr:hypothetical protein [Deltaproteobacteria bacterium]
MLVSRTFIKDIWTHSKNVACFSALVLLFSLLSSCQTPSYSLSETLVSRSAKTLRENASPAENIHRDETIIILGNSAAVFFVDLAENTPDQLSHDLSDILNRRLEQMMFFNSVQKTDDLDLLFKKNRSLNQLKDLYLDSLSRVSVSNKDISNRMGKYLKVANLVVLQIDRWPCQECKAPYQSRIKLRVIDAPSGLIIWTGINEIASDNAADITPPNVLALSEEILDSFQHRFKRKWHRIRYQNLSLLAKN